MAITQEESSVLADLSQGVFSGSDQPSYVHDIDGASSNDRS